MDWFDASAPGMLSRSLNVDWSTLGDRQIDPYLLWADLTAFQSIAREGPPGQPGTDPIGALRIAVEFADPAVLPLDHDVVWHKVLPIADPVFATAFVQPGALAALLADRRVRRIELGFRAPVDWPGEPGVAPPATPTRLLKATKRATVAVIDFGCAFAHERFRRWDGDRWRSRIAYLWDQGRARRPSADDPWRDVQGPGYGRELDAEAIDQLLADHRRGVAIDEDMLYQAADFHTVQPTLMHGTHVLDLAAGEDPRAPLESGAEIIFVQLPDFAIADTSGGSMVTHVLDALRYIFDRTGPTALLVINLSYGSMAGPHDGSTLVEAAMDAMIAEAMGPVGTTALPDRHLAIVLPAGNSFEADAHAELSLSARQPSKHLLWQVQSDNPTDAFLEIWYPRSSAGQVVVFVTPPGGPRESIPIDRVTALRRSPGGEPIAAVIHRRHASAGTDDALVLVALAPTRTRDDRRAVAPAGIWTVEVGLVAPASVAKAVRLHAWIERDDPPIGSGAPPRQSRFLTGRVPLGPNEDSPAKCLVQRRGTCNSIANGTRTIVVGACTGKTDFVSMAAYSSAGPTRNPERNKKGSFWPDLVAPAEISSALAGKRAAGTRSGINARMNGTSVAAPQVARAIAQTGLKPPGVPTMHNQYGGDVKEPPPRIVIKPTDASHGTKRTGRGFLPPLSGD